MRVDSSHFMCPETKMAENGSLNLIQPLPLSTTLGTTPAHSFTVIPMLLSEPTQHEISREDSVAK